MCGSGIREEKQVCEVMNYSYNAIFQWSGIFTADARLLVSNKDEWDWQYAKYFGPSEPPAPGGEVSLFRQKLFGFLNFLNRSTGEFIVGDKLTMADLWAFNVLCNWFKASARDIFTAEFPDLEAYIVRVAACAKVADYIRTK